MLNLKIDAQSISSSLVSFKLYFSICVGVVEYSNELVLDIVVHVFVLIARRVVELGPDLDAKDSRSVVLALVEESDPAKFV